MLFKQNTHFSIPKWKPSFLSNEAQQECLAQNRLKTGMLTVSSEIWINCYTGVHLGQKLISQNWPKIGWISSQGHGKWQNHIDFERKKVKKILHPTKVTNPHFFFLGLFSNLVLKVEAYYSFLMRTHGLESLLKWSSHVRLSKFINCSWGPQGAHRKKWG